MQTIIHGEKKIESELHLALGVFDGVHVGHQEVIKRSVARAKQAGVLSAVLTFEPHPIRVLAPSKAPRRILASLEHKEKLLADLGVDVLIVVDFTAEFSKLDAAGFLAAIHDYYPKLKTLAMGEDWKFGQGRMGNVGFLQEFGAKNQIEIAAVAPVMVDGERVSSTRIRQAIRDGNIAKASEMLGRVYTVLGTVVHGRQLGRTIGFPTANLRVQNEQLPPDGVWVVEALVNGKWTRGAGNLGKRPTVETGEAERLFEVHLLDFDADIYGQDIEVRFLKYLRGEQKFASIDELLAQIMLDVEECRLYSAS
ncbi:bifunctional riboflavin kinase/FAD synthetase [Persicirhabdus sediminis]|uniref:Riboflavin biosynthesis protein n=1 Tax=Persicirhabdus sediminis TaxID=454144 RepID=A0A8J7SMQ7_9BACT|nr:bifunctional riboflavin kinase/FAD synthetase [Persicirhabdus sediminis]MBK1791253.1 bifunctional riboflavin kinase/FAD synthetase [Persicirhabdus sediminis]